MGRLSEFKEVLADEICERLSKGETLASICRDEKMPAVRTVSDWKARHPEFAADFARARDEGFDAIAQDCLEIADHTGLDTIIGDENRDDRPNSEWIQRSKLRIETRLKLLAKWDPKRYGDKLEVDATIEGAVHVVIGGDA